MFQMIKKAAIITKNNPILTLAFVIYLIVISFLLPKLALIQNVYLLIVFAVVMILFAGAFFAGWFGMMKQAITNSYKNYENEETKVIDSLNTRNQFFVNVAAYILPVLAVFILYGILFYLWTQLNVYLAEHFIGKIDFIFEDLKNLGQGKENTMQYILALPEEKQMIIYGWNALFSFAYFVFGFLTVFWLAALYYGKCGSKNPFRALWMSLTAIFRKPLGVIGLNVFMAVAMMFFMIIGKLMGANAVLAFIYMILMIYLIVYFNVLILCYYDKNLADNCNNGSDCIGENKEVDTTGEAS